MYLTLSLHFSALYLFFLLAHTLPIKPLDSLSDLAPQKRTSYSVVDIDGSSPPPLSVTTTPAVRTVTQTIDDTKTLTVFPSPLTSSEKSSASTLADTKSTTQAPVIPISTVTSISTLRITTVELKTSISVVTKLALETIRPPAVYVTVNPPVGTPTPPEVLLFTQISTLIVTSNTGIASATTTKKSPSLRPSITSSQSSTPTSTTISSQSSISSANFATRSWSNSYPYINNSSSTACGAAASTAPANVRWI